eukprot:962545-Pleurochrysis_carterae.AAC.3
MRASRTPYPKLVDCLSEAAFRSSLIKKLGGNGAITSVLPDGEIADSCQSRSLWRFLWQTVEIPHLPHLDVPIIHSYP